MTTTPRRIGPRPVRAAAPLAPEQREARRDARVALLQASLDREVAVHARLVQRVADLRQANGGSTYGTTWGGGSSQIAATTAARSLNRRRAAIRQAEKNLATYLRAIGRTWEGRHAVAATLPQPPDTATL